MHSNRAVHNIEYLLAAPPSRRGQRRRRKKVTAAYPTLMSFLLGDATGWRVVYMNLRPTEIKVIGNPDSLRNQVHSGHRSVRGPGSARRRVTAVSRSKVRRRTANGRFIDRLAHRVASVTSVRPNRRRSQMAKLRVALPLSWVRIGF